MIAQEAASAFAASIATRTSGRVSLDAARVLDRSTDLILREPSQVSANGSCRMVRAADGWIAVNLPRADDLALVPAWLGCAVEADPWPAIERTVPTRSKRALVEQATVLGLAVAGVADTRAATPEPLCHVVSQPLAPRDPARCSVIDLSALWAGPLCGAILAANGADVVKVESRSRPDPVAWSTPALHRFLNGGKRSRTIDFADPAAMDELRQAIFTTDILITSGRARAFDALELSRERVFARNPGLIWIAITGHGFVGEGAMRIGFGDDAAAAGGLIGWTRDAQPHFVGDAVADPLTGLVAAIAALDACRDGGGVLIDAALARTAAGVVSRYG